MTNFRSRESNEREDTLVRSVTGACICVSVGACIESRDAWDAPVTNAVSATVGTVPAAAACSAYIISRAVAYRSDGFLDSARCQIA